MNPAGMPCASKTAQSQRLNRCRRQSSLEQRDCLSAATAVMAAICSGAEAEEAFPCVGIEFLCPPLPLPLATLGFKRCLHIVWQEAAYMVTIEDHRLLHIVKI